jgi:hypothetical protein
MTRRTSLGITIKYQGLKDAPALLTPEGRLPALRSGDSAAEQLTLPGGLYLGQGGAQLRLLMRQQEQERVLGEVGRRVQALGRAIDDLPVPASDLTSGVKTALSPDPAALSVTADQEAQAPASYTVDAQWPAHGGLILSKPQNPIAAIALDDGEHTFTLTVDGVEHQLSVKAYNGSVRDDQSLLGDRARPSTDTQEAFLGRLARAIDGVDPRVKASLEYSFEDAQDPGPRSRPLNRVVRLKVESVAEGRGPDFSLSDESGQTVSAYQLGQQQPPRSARVRLLGALHDQDANQISLDDGHVTGQILDATNGPLEVTVAQGPRPFTQAFGALVSQYNDLVSYLDTHADVLRPALKDRIIRPLEQRARTLDAVGLRPSPQGRLTPTSLFTQQVRGDFGAARQALVGGKGWLTDLGKKLRQIQATGLENFGQGLSRTTLAEQRQRAWSLIGEVRAEIIDGYY